MLGQTVTRVAGGEKGTAVGQDSVVFLEVGQNFRTVRMQKDRRKEFLRLNDKDKRRSSEEGNSCWKNKVTNKEKCNTRAKTLTWCS